MKFDSSWWIPFVWDRSFSLSKVDRLRLASRYAETSLMLPSAHTQDEMFSFAREILALPPSEPGVIVEAGCFKGSSTAKFSLAARRAGRTLVVFDSFKGIPPNDEKHDHNIFGGSSGFAEGDYCGTLEEVRGNVRRYGAIEVSVFVEGFFESTMPRFSQPVAAAYIDVDLVSSTRTCVKCLYPLLREGGAIYSQDCHLPLVIDLLNDDSFWMEEVGFPKPRMIGLGKQKLVKIEKPRREGVVRCGTPARS